MFETLWPDYYDFDHVMDIKATMDPPSDWWALWKGTPRDAEGIVVKKAWFTRYDHVPRNRVDTLGRIAERVVKRCTVSVDCAEKATARSKYTAVTVWIETEDNRHHLVDVRRKRVEFPDMIKLIEDTARDWIDKGYPVGCILVEDAANGTPYLQQRAGLAPAPLIRIPKPSADSKVRRFDGTTTMWEGGEVLLPKSAKWLPDYEDEILGFPDGTFSDQVDSTSQYLTWARAKRRVYGTKKLFSNEAA
jgi:predicted phage terminase large subunit-like protein